MRALERPARLLLPVPHEESMSHRFRFLLSLVSSVALAVPLSAEDRLLVAADLGVLMQADTDVGTFEAFAPSCWCPIQALAADRQRLYTGGDDELVRVYDLETGELETFFWPRLGPIRALAASGGVVFVGTSAVFGRSIMRWSEDGGMSAPASRVAAFGHDGTPLGERTVPGRLRALAVYREFLFAAVDEGTIHRAPLAGGAFEPFADVGRSRVRDMCVVDSDLAVVDAAGTVVRLSAESGAHNASFTVGSAPRTMTRLGSTLLVYHEGDGSGWIRQFDARTGAPLPSGFQVPNQPIVMRVIPERTGRLAPRRQ
jgi:hypothetical protein